MRTHPGSLAITIALLFASSLALAQNEPLRNDEYGVTFSPPEGWVEVDGNDRAIFNIKHDESQSQIEVIATELMSVDVANVFYDTFHETLEQSEFDRDTREDQEIGSHSGKLTQYNFEYAGVMLRVVVFEFTVGTTAYLVVGYIKGDEFETHYPAFQQAVESITFDS